MARDYTKIKAWQLADELALLVYRATREFPKDENPARVNFVHGKV
jgi:hypothetical protein